MIDETSFISRVTPIFREELEQDHLQVTMDTTQEALEKWDSLAHVRLVLGIEQAFDVQLEASEIEKVNSVRAFYDIVRDRGQ